MIVSWVVVFKGRHMTYKRFWRTLTRPGEVTEGTFKWIWGQPERHRKKKKSTMPKKWAPKTKGSARITSKGNICWKWTYRATTALLSKQACTLPRWMEGEPLFMMGESPSKQNITQRRQGFWAGKYPTKSNNTKRCVFDGIWPPCWTWKNMYTDQTGKVPVKS